MFARIHIRVGACACVFACIHMCAGDVHVSLRKPEASLAAHPVMWYSVSHWTWSTQAVQWVPRIQPSLPSTTRDCATMLHCLTQGLNSGPHACTICTLLTEQSSQTCNNPLCMGSCYIRVEQSTWAEEFKINVYFWRLCIVRRFWGPLLFHKKTLLIEGTLSFQAALTWEGDREAHVPLMTMVCRNCWILGWAVNLITVCHVLLNWSPIEQ